jgi:hypothetical protein
MARLVHCGRTSMPRTRLSAAAPFGTSRKSRRVMPDPDLQMRGMVPHHITGAIEGLGCVGWLKRQVISQKAQWTTGPRDMGSVINSTAGVKSAGSQASADDGVHRREHEVSRKTIAQGRPECFRLTCMLVCAFLCANCTRDRGCSVHPVFPAPSLIRWRANENANLGRNAPRDRGVISTSLRAQRSNPRLRLPRYGLLRCARNDGVKTGLQPPGWPSRSPIFSPLAISPWPQNALWCLLASRLAK